MTSLGLTALVQVIVAASGGETYADAHRETMETGRPLVVVVGADWCPACKVLNTTVIPQVRQRGLLRKVAFAIVNYDREQQLADQLTDHGPIPQILTFRRTADGWRMRRLIGAQSVDTVENFISEAIQLQEAAARTQPAGDDGSVAGKPQRSPGPG
ncbi:MAG: thioredoxin family protein [Thermoguttaceae bacterium]|jgi:thioredoxin-like negative regulator of GroEL|nr:thioredoxin family protein [Thermoguttaceae bacterium]